MDPKLHFKYVTLNFNQDLFKLVLKDRGWSQSTDANLTGQNLEHSQEAAAYLTPPLRDQIHLLLCEKLSILKVQSEDDVERFLRGVVTVNRGKNIT